MITGYKVFYEAIKEEAEKRHTEILFLLRSQKYINHHALDNIKGFNYEQILSDSDLLFNYFSSLNKSESILLMSKDKHFEEASKIERIVSKIESLREYLSPLFNKIKESEND